MIDIEKLTNQISAVVKCPVKFGIEDTSPSEYPLIQIVPDNGIDMYRWTRRGMAVTINLTLHFIADRENEVSAFNLFYELMKCINDINFGEGLSIGDTDTLDDPSANGTTEYTENDFRIMIPLQYKDIINKET